MKMSKKEKRLRREVLAKHGIEDGAIIPVWVRKRRTGKPDGAFVTCPSCREITFVPARERPGFCSRPTCRKRIK